jgi:predicted RNA-binding Zn ribbon-like protein
MMVLMLPDPGDRAPAPPPLRLIQAFVNTLDIENDRDELTTREQLRSLLVDLGILAGASPVTDSDLRTARELREAIRELLLANNGGTVGPSALAVLERTARLAHFSLSFSEDGRCELLPQAPGVDAALGRIVAVVQSAVAAGTWRRLKACRRGVCHWVFYDRSRNRSSTWCAMTVCGNRTKTHRYRTRRSAAR